MEELLKYLGFTTPLIYAGAAYAFFHWLDENASDEAKAALARTMRLKDYKNEQVASAGGSNGGSRRPLGVITDSDAKLCLPLVCMA